MNLPAAIHPENQAAVRWTRPAGSLFAGVLVGLVLGAMLLALVATRLFGFALLTVNSDSMAPAIEAGDVIVVKPISPGSIEPGDVILFQSGTDRVPTVHRVVGIYEQEAQLTSRSTGTTTSTTTYRFATRGDANDAPDAGTVLQERILGEVWLTVPHAGSIVGMPARAALLTAGAFFGAIWVALEAARRVRTRR